MAATAAPPLPSLLAPGPAIDYRKLAFNPDRWQQRGVSTQLFPWTSAL